MHIFCITYTYDLITEESVSDGDTAEGGYCDVDGGYRFQDHRTYPAVISGSGDQVKLYRVPWKRDRSLRCGPWAAAIQHAAELRRSGIVDARAVRSVDWYACPGEGMAEAHLIRGLICRDKIGAPDTYTAQDYAEWAEDREGAAAAWSGADEATRLLFIGYVLGTEYDPGNRCDDSWPGYTSSDDAWSDETLDGTPATLSMTAHIDRE